MSKKDEKPVKHDGELSEQQLEKIAGGQEVRKMETIVVTAQREQPQVVKMGQIVVNAKREKEPATQVASADPASTKKN
jgi:hypothetical protein